MTKMFDFTVGTSVFNVSEPDASPDNWLITKSEQYRPDKKKFVIDEFKLSFPKIKVKDAEQIYALASRSSVINEWLSKTNVKYATVEGAPTYFRQYVDADEFKQASDVVLKVSKAYADKAKAQAQAASDYKKALEEIDKEYETRTKTTNNVAKILILNSTQLPLTIQLAIDNYTPATNSAPNQKAFARECLVNYKVALLEALQKDKKMDVDKVINENLEK